MALAAPPSARSLGLEHRCGSSSACHCLLVCSSDKDDPLLMNPPDRRIRLIAPTVVGTQKEHRQSGCMN